MIKIVQSKILSEEYTSRLYDSSCGAVVTFEGRVRDHNDEKKVIKLSYDCYYPMAMKILEEIRKNTLTRWNLSKLLIVHRIGEISIGEISIWIGVASVHRQEAFESCRFVIDEIKVKAPIWKKEIYSDGDYTWIEGCKHESSLNGHAGSEYSKGLSCL